MQLGRSGEPDQSTLTRIQITDAKHRLRSSKAEEHTRECYDRCDLPALARDGGDVTGNPNTKEQRRVSRGEQNSSSNDLAYNSGAHVFINHVTDATSAETRAAWAKRYESTNKKHLEIGSRGVNPFQASGLLGYECGTGHLTCLFDVHRQYSDRRGTGLVDPFAICSFQYTFVEPMSHSILYALLRAFVDLICHSGNGIWVDGQKFSICIDVLRRMDTFSEKIEYPCAYNRRPPKLRRCVHPYLF